jgi:N-acetyl sugar amidotransferase
MDTSASDINFDEGGVCNYCREFTARSSDVLRGDLGSRSRKAADFISRVRAAGRGKRYDCVIGVSGGVDSSWVLVQAVELGLRPLAVHMDNGWNTELAQNNIANLVRALGVDLYTHVIEWDEYRSLMQAFFDADVVDVELLYDNAMIAVNYRQAARHEVRYILAGTNQATEGMRMPPEWNWLKHDKRNIKALARRRAVRLRTFPAIGTLSFMFYEGIRRIRWISILDMLEYRKGEALDQLQQRFGYVPYPYKHYESVFTRFYQGFLLPEKFGIDKRRVHLSTLVVAGQMSREEALEALAAAPYPSARQLAEDTQYFLKKMGWTPAELEDYLRRPARRHDAYPSERRLWEFFASLHRRVTRRGSRRQDLGHEASVELSVQSAVGRPDRS